MTYLPPQSVIRRARRSRDSGDNPRAIEELDEWSITMDDVAAVMGVTTRAARFWYTGGRQGVLLATRAYDTGAENPRRVTSVLALLDFCRRAQITDPDWSQLPPAAQKRLGVTPGASIHLPPPGVGASMHEHVEEAIS